MATKITDILICQDSIYDIAGALTQFSKGIDWVTDLKDPKKKLNVTPGTPIDVIFKKGRKICGVYHMTVVKGDHQGRAINDQQFWKKKSEFKRTQNHWFVTVQ